MPWSGCTAERCGTGVARDQSMSAAIVPGCRRLRSSFDRDLVDHIPLQHGRVVPVGIFVLVEDTTYLGRPLILSARSLLRGGQSSAKIS